MDKIEGWEEEGVGSRFAACMRRIGQRKEWTSFLDLERQSAQTFFSFMLADNFFSKNV